jgi:hypothetical protein
MTGPSPYLPVILRSEPGKIEALADLEDANDTLTPLVRYWNSIAADFSGETVHLHR